jgi:hypothetical protein
VNSSLTVRRWLAVLFLSVVFAAAIFWGCSSGMVTVPPGTHVPEPPIKVPPPRPIGTDPPPMKPPFPYAVTSSVNVMDVTTPQGSSPAAQNITVGANSPCPPPEGVPGCNWNVSFSSDQFWIVLAADSGSMTPFPLSVGFLTQELGPGMYTGHIILNNPQFTPATTTVTVNLTVTAVPTIQHRVLLEWGKSPTPTVIGYNLLRSLNADLSAPVVVNGAALVPHEAFWDTTPVSGQIYYYGVVAADTNGTFSTPSNITTVTIPFP